MSSTAFIDTVTHVPSSWANDLNTFVYVIFNGAQDLLSVKNVLGLKGLAFIDPSLAALTGGTIDGMPIGGTNPQAGRFTSVTLSNPITVPQQAATKAYVDSAVAPVLSAFGSLGAQNYNNVSITGGTIDGTAIGSTTPSSGVFTTIRSSHVASLSIDLVNKAYFDSYIASLPTLGNMSLQNSTTISVTGGTIDGTTIGGTAAAAGTFSSLTAPSLVGTKGIAFLNGAAAGFTSYGVFLQATSSSLPHVGFQLGHLVSQFTVNALAGNVILKLTSTGRLLLNNTNDDGASAFQSGGDISATRYLLSSPITLPNQAASKLYVDTLLSTVNSTLGVLQTFNGNFGSLSTQNFTALHVTGGTMDGVVIGGTTAAAATFSTLNIVSTVVGALGGGVIHFEPLSNYGMSLSTSSHFYTDMKLSVPATGKIDMTSGPNTIMSVISAGRVLIGNGSTDDALSALQVKGDLKVSGQIRLSGVQMSGSGAALFGANCPANVLSSPRTWVKVILPGEVVGWMPVFV